MKTTITAHERLQLIGLFTLAAKHEAILTQIREAAEDITGEGDICGHTADAIWTANLRDVDGLLSRLKITVVD